LVTAVFEDGPLSFMLPRGATLEDLAGRLDPLHYGPHRMPVAIKVEFGQVKFGSLRSADALGPLAVTQRAAGGAIDAQCWRATRATKPTRATERWDERAIEC
jgi:hypothetical protein